MEFHIAFPLIVFSLVILVIAFDLIDMLLAALVGVCALIVSGCLTAEDLMDITSMSSGPIALLFGGMVVAGTLKPTGLFEWLGSRYLHFTRGSGKRFLLGLVGLVTPMCAFLPNATTVILLAPVIIQVANRLKIDFVSPMILVAIVSNSAGLLTLVGDPATFMVGSAINMSFVQYIKTVSLGGLLTILVIIPFLPLLMKDIWHTQRTLPDGTLAESIRKPWFCAFALSVLAIMVVLFLSGESLPHPLGPPAVAIVAATLALLVIYQAKVESIERVIQGIDWKTLIFLVCLFCLVEAVNKTGLLQMVSQYLYAWLGRDLVAVSLVLLMGVGIVSGFLANIPVIAVMIVTVKGYLVTAELVPELALAANYADWPVSLWPVFVAMMFAGTLGGNATLIGASANVISVGICAVNGKPVSFRRFLSYGLPLMAAQLSISALYVVLLFKFGTF